MKIKIPRSELLKSKGKVAIPDKLLKHRINDEQRVNLDRALIELATTIKNEREEDYKSPLLGEKNVYVK